MRYVAIQHNGKPVLGLRTADGNIGIIGDESIESLLARGVDLARHGAQQAVGEVVSASEAAYLPPLARPPKIICVGLNYADHAKETKLEQPDYPTLFLRVPTSLAAHQAPLVRPAASDSLDFEGEVAVVLGKGGRFVDRERALELVAGYALFNDGSVREYQFRTTQWTAGKNFDRTGGFGPDLVTADELPPGARGLRIETRLNGQVVQSANTSDMLFDVATLISLISDVMTLEPGDVIVSGTPAGIGWTREPRLLMKAGDVCEVTVEGLGTLRNPVVDEADAG
ncbi:fumarylacetoacetate hydrolase family protein [Pigmentiphaga soli]|uniref:Fumarylacetoacetate hydrolase family protein n=1 Tax=Pigmentiphaga soli TaxID=1007095 RepID=A0ABP8HQY5_9BURK